MTKEEALEIINTWKLEMETFCGLDFLLQRVVDAHYIHDGKGSIILFYVWAGDHMAIKAHPDKFVPYYTTETLIKALNQVAENYQNYAN